MHEYIWCPDLKAQTDHLKGQCVRFTIINSEKQGVIYEALFILVFNHFHIALLHMAVLLFA